MAERFGLAIGIIAVQALEAYIFIKGLRLPSRWTPWIIALFVVVNLALPYVLWLQAGARQPSSLTAFLVVRPFFAWQFNWLTFLVFITPLIVIGWAAAWLLGSEAVVSVMRWSILIVAGISGLVTLYGLYNTRKPPEIKTVEISIPGLSPELDGIKIAHLSDTHVAWWNSKEEFEKVGDQIAGLDPDLLMVSGDMVDHHPDYVYAFADCLENVKPRLGRYAVIGNHDVYTGREPVARRMEERGFTMLRSECVNLDDKGAELSLAGYDDSGKSWTSGDPAMNKIPAAISDCKPGRPVILLTHRPPRFSKLKDSPVVLALSGHTHGGQFRLPFGGPGLADLTFEHASGLYQKGGHSLYVTHGTGTVGWPFRLFCPADVTLIVLQSEK